MADVASASRSGDALASGNPNPSERGPASTLDPSRDTRCKGDGAGGLNILYLEPRSMLRQALPFALMQNAPEFRIIAVPDLTSAPLDLSYDAAIVGIGQRTASCDATRNAIARVQDLVQPAPVVVLAATDDPDQICFVLQQQVRGYLTLDLDLGVAAAAIRFVLMGGTYVPASSLLRGA